MLILDIEDHNIIFLQNFETIDKTYAFCEKQFTILNNIPPFRSNGNMTSSYHPMGKRECIQDLQEVHIDDETLARDMKLTDNNKAWFIILKDASLAKTYSLSWDSIWD